MTSEDVLANLADRLDAVSIEAFVTWSESSKTGNTVVLGYPIYSELEREWHDLVRKLGADDGKPGYNDILQGLAPPPSLVGIAAADIDTLRAYALYIIRGERFCDGHIEQAQKDGLLSAILRRFIILEKTL